ncbi:hypothetical protein F0562_000031 [Nyssa sinensis]|uniref:UDP-glycosyltransferases domain-containing protein n=1 Tax=Nyssa sinensis TaxID=561372 RepID=A0A5J5C340_9ASTE|nr:hypothetical protein F0562_000031 [Nyssa sinensis]
MMDRHILLLSFPAQGSINPLFQFAKHLMRMGVKVTILTSVSTHRRITKTAAIPEGLTIVEFSDGYEDGLKNGDDFDQFVSEFRSHGSRAVVEFFAASIREGHPVTRLVYTMLLTWAAKLAHDLHIPSTPFWVQPATVFQIYYYYFNGYGDLIGKNSSDPSCPIEIPGLPLLTSRDLPSLLAPPNSNRYSFLLPILKEQLDLLDTETKPKILVNTFDAIEPEALRAIEKFNMIAVGPLVSSASLEREDPSETQKSRDYVEWLNSKPESSVVYVSFGSIAVLSNQQMEEIARGLLESHRPFIWVIRAMEIGVKQEDKLGCREELEKQGMIVPWCSQVDVLSHPSLGCFFTHCGWNSSLESLVSGIPVVGFPQFTDQPTIAKLIEDVWKTGVRLTANEEGLVKGDEIKRCIEMVMGGGQRGEELSKNAKKWKALARDALKEAQGAINPAFQLAKHLIRMGVKVTIVTTVSAHRRMTKSAPIPDDLTIAAFSGGYDEGFKNRDDHQHFLSEYRSHGSRAVAELITASRKEGHPITRLVYTMLQTWAAKLAHDLHIPSTPFWIQPATVFQIYYYYFNGYGDLIGKNSSDPSCPIEIPGLPLLTSRDLPSFLVPSDSNRYSFALPIFKEQLELLDAETKPKILVNTFDAIEPEALRAIEKFNLIAVGPLVSSASLEREDPSETQTSRDYVEWLNSKPKSSVVYVSFGSVVLLSKLQMEEIARGLLESHRPFIWVIRAMEIGDKQEDKLGFREELEKQGMIVPWCSQVDVLSHPSLGCFFTHCGWNSSLESLVSGIPVVGFPQFTDQPTIAKLIEDVWKTGARLTANEEGLVKGDEIKRCIEMVMGGGQRGEELSKNAKKWKALARDALKEGGSLDINLKAFVDEL